MRRREASAVKTDEAQYMFVDDEVEIVVDASAYDPVDHAALTTRTIPRGTPMAPVGTTGHYEPIRRTLTATNMGVGATTLCLVNDASPFRVGDVCVVFTTTLDNGVPAVAVTISAGSTITAVSYAAGQLTWGATVVNVTGAYVEVAENGHWHALAGGLADYDAVILNETVQNTDTDAGTTSCVLARGAVAGRVEAHYINGPDANGVDALLEMDLPRFTFIANTPGT